MIVLILLVILIACVVQHNHASHLTWTNITVDFGVRTIINVTAGSSESGRLLGILGPSGCGKTTLLRVLSSRMQATHGVVIYSGEISDFEKEDTTLQKHEVAFVHQDDTFFPMLTVEETMRLAAQLRRISDSRSFPTDSRIPESTPSADDGVIRIMRSLGLIHVASSFVGSKSSGGRNADANSRRGISGGERKRLAVGSQMTGSPKLLIADEPTSGLDSFNSQRLVQLLRDLAVKEQLIVMCTIHQPRSSIWNMFDDVMLLTPYGQTAYHGPRAEAVEYFSNLGYHCPAATNPAEFLVDLVSIDSSTIESKKDSEARIAHLTVSFAAAAAYTSVGGGVSQITMAGARRAVKSSLFRPLQIAAKRTWLLFQRSVRQTLRDYATNIVRLGTSGVLAIVVGSVYGRQGHLISSESVAGRVNIIAQAVINVAMLSMIKTLQLFKKERSVVDRERAQEQYTSLEYLIAKSCAELPMDAMVSAWFGLVLHWRTRMRCSVGKFSRLLALLGSVSSALGLAVGALAPSGDVALAVGPALMVVYLIMGSIGPSGIDSSKLPSVLKPFRSLSPMRWGCEALCGAEFKGQSFVSAQRENRNLGYPLRAAVDVGKKIFAVATRTVRGKRIPSSQFEGDMVLDKLGIADASYDQASSILWGMLATHLGCALVGLIRACPDE